MAGFGPRAQAMASSRRFRTIQVCPKDLRVLPEHPEPAVSWHSGFGEEPMLGIRRRQFITLVAGAAAWPLKARAQQGARVRRIGMLLNTAADDTVFQARIGAFLQGLALLGWTIGHNVRIEIRWSGGKADEARRYATELAALAPDVILAHGVSSVRPLLQATRTVPIVFPIA